MGVLQLEFAIHRSRSLSQLVILAVSVFTLRMRPLIVILITSWSDPRFVPTFCHKACRVPIRSKRSGVVSLVVLMPMRVELSLALLQATNTTWREANLRLRIDQNQNTATVSTPTKDMAMNLIEVSKIKVGETEHSVEMYGLAPDDAVKGVIHGVPT
ncbi:hypothetical protein HPB49_009744 [Dermacentor silvarum]|uniref:Uncharacterized protein n=1 Tax=Dermacentor silvarum TaxID=543639 RepID=A0ACB8DNF7_DERSI|nr:hypothetical protein HPB49_009744 [Dermacentor silvarum]